MTILIVEDNAQYANKLREFLQSNNMDTLIAHTGEEALKILKQATPDLIISDINIGRMDGFQLLKTIRSKDQQTPFILYTSMNAPSEYEELALRYGANKFIANASLKDTWYEIMNKFNSAFERNQMVASRLI